MPGDYICFRCQDRGCGGGKNSTCPIDLFFSMKYSTTDSSIEETASNIINEMRGHWLGEWCKRCNRRNVVGFDVSDEDWAAVVGEETVWCLACFDERAEQLGVRYVLRSHVRPIAWHEWTRPGS